MGVTNAIPPVNTAIGTLSDAAAATAAKFPAAVQPIYTTFDQIKAAAAETAKSLQLNPTVTTPAGQAAGGLINSYNVGGLIKYFADGGIARGIDRHMIMAADGEFIVNPASTRRFLPQLVQLNRGQAPTFNNKTSNTNVGDINITITGYEVRNKLFVKSGLNFVEKLDAVQSSFNDLYNQHRRYLMRKNTFVPSLDSKLEDRVVLSTLRPIAMRSAIVIAEPPTTQASLNFTSHTYWQITIGAGGRQARDLERVADWIEDGNISKAVQNLAKLAKRVPYGVTNLLPVWLETARNNIGLDFGNH